MAEYYLDDGITQPVWDNSVTPRIEIDLGDTVVIECAEPVGQITLSSTADDLTNLDFGKLQALTGSIYIKGVKAGDTLEVEILEMKHKGWGWTVYIPGFGLLQEDVDYAYIHHGDLDGNCCNFGTNNILVPFELFSGCVSVAPAETVRLDGECKKCCTLHD